MQAKVFRHLSYAAAAAIIGAGVIVPTTSYAAGGDASRNPAPTPVKPIANQLIIDGVTYDVAVLPDFNPTADVVVAGPPQSSSQKSTIPSTDAVTLSPDASVQSGCGSYDFSIPGTGATYTSVPGCSYIGTTASTNAAYTWSGNFNSNGKACMSGKGYYRQSQANNVYLVYWRGLGCAHSGSGIVSWGAVASTKQMRGYVAAPPVGWGGSFT